MMFQSVEYSELLLFYFNFVKNIIAKQTNKRLLPVATHGHLTSRKSIRASGNHES
jgi:hypothetical protein